MPKSWWNRLDALGDRGHMALTREALECDGDWLTGYDTSRAPRDTSDQKDDMVFRSGALWDVRN